MSPEIEPPSQIESTTTIAPPHPQPRIFVNIAAKCNRRVESLTRLFSPSFDPTLCPCFRWSSSRWVGGLRSALASVVKAEDAMGFLERKSLDLVRNRK
ncbi:hypothetical protein ACFX2C_046975 [Malus domestica]